MIQFTLSNGQPVNLQTAPVKKFKGLRLPGANLLQAQESTFTIFNHEYERRLFRYSIRSFRASLPLHLKVRENSTYLRLEIILAGEVSITQLDQKAVRMLAGQYRFTRVSNYDIHIAADDDCSYFVGFLSDELIKQSPSYTTIQSTHVLPLPTAMQEIVHRICENPYEMDLRDAYYDYTVRELLFNHLSSTSYTPPGEMTPEEIAAVHAADNIIAADLSKHYTIQALARMVNTNAHVLKTGFARIYGMGVFERLMHRRMERGKLLLASTNKQIQEISILAGYDTVAGFITAFRRQFKMTPKDWRKKSRGLL